MIDAVVVSCEHGGNRIPRPYRPFFEGKTARAALTSHLGYDPGALPLARRLASRLDAPLIAATVSRLLIELNRSLDHPQLFSAFLDDLPAPAKAAIVRRYYLPHRRRVERTIAALTARGRTVLHLAVHSFTAVLDGKARRADIGILYDPDRPRERQLSRRYQALLRSSIPTRLAATPRVWLNYPYRGYTDGLTTAFRRRFPARQYVGIELEVIQTWLTGPRREPTIRAVVHATEALVTTRRAAVD